MDAARDAISRHTSRKGHFTNVDEVVRPAVTLETIKPHRHEVMTEAIDKEVHQHHHHTTVVPLTHQQTLPTKHSHNLLPVKKIHHQHENPAETQRALSELAAHFRDTLTTLPTTHSISQAPRVVGEHYHHHVHEIVQPVIYKETIQQEHVHTTIPVHEVHHVVAKHHGLSALPMKPMEEFLAFHKGRTPDHVTQSTFEGPPRPYDSKLSTTFEKLGFHHGHNGNHGMNNTGIHGSNHNENRGLNSTTGPHGTNAIAGSNGLNNNGTHGLDRNDARGLNNNGMHGMNSTSGTHGMNNMGTHGLVHNGTNNTMSSNVPAPLNTTGSTDPNGRLLQRKPTPPRTPVLQQNNNQTHRRSHGRDGMSPVSRGSLSSMSSASSVSSSAPSTPTSPSRRHIIGNKTITTVSPTHTTVSGPLNSHTTTKGPMGTIVDTTTSTHHNRLGNNNNSTMTPMSNNNTVSPMSNTNTMTPLSNTSNNYNNTNNAMNPMTNNMNNNNNLTSTMGGNKHVSANEPVQIVSADESPRTSDENYPNRQRGSFISRLSGQRNSTGATRRF